MAVTIYDLAREAGVSISTVSKALSGSYTISEKTRRHVLETARRLQYKPNARARSFARQKSGTVIFATELYQSISFENPHMFAILTGVTRSLEEKGYSVLLKYMDKGGATAYVRELMQERLADGVILHAALLSRDLAAFLSHAVAPGAGPAQTESAAAEVQKRPLQKRPDGLLDAPAHPGVLPGALLHALDVKAVLNGADGLVEQRPGIPAYLRHGGFDVARVGRTHPAAAIVAAGVAFADSAELRG